MTGTNEPQSLVIVGSYADAGQPGIHLFRFDATTGALLACGSYAEMTNPSFLVAHPNGRWLYAVSETSQADGGPGSVWALRLERDPVAIQTINHQPSAGDSPCHAQLDRTGSWLLVSNYSSGSVAVLPILSDGSLGSMTAAVQHAGRSMHPERQTAPHAHSAIFAPDNRYAIVADLGMDQLVVYAFDSAAGTLRPHASTAAKPGAGPRHMAFHPQGDRLYVTNELNGSITVYNYEASSGALDERQTIDTAPSQEAENLVAHIHLSSSGQRAYVSNRGPNTIAVFDTADDGQVTRVVVQPCGGDWPRHFTQAADRYLLVANQYSGEVSVLPLQGDNAPIGSAIGRVTVPQATCVQWLESNNGSTTDAAI